VLGDDAALAALIATLRTAWLARAPVTVALDAQVVEHPLLAAPSERRAVWKLGAHHRLLGEELVFLLRANLYDARAVARRRAGTRQPVWWPTEQAVARGALRGTGGPDAPDAPDVYWPGPAWIDGGPRGPVTGWPTDRELLHRESLLLPGRPRPLGHARPTEALSPAQRAAVEHPAGPARVLAPAGAGKTRVLGARLRHLVRDRGVEPQLVTALAYNTRAAEELVARTADVRRDGAHPQVRTVHALGLAVCRLAAQARGEAPPGMLDEEEVRDAVGGLLGRADAETVAAHVTALGLVRLGLCDPEELAATDDTLSRLPALVVRHRDRLRVHRLLDFDEQVLRAIELLLADPVLRRRVRVATTHLLVDEAQDLTPAFVLLVRLLAGPAQQVFAVGDDDQTIYGHTGATPRVLVDFATVFPGAASHVLAENHRCPPAVVRAADLLLRHNTLRVPKDIRAARPEDPRSPSGLTLREVGRDEVLAAACAAIHRRLAGGSEQDDAAGTDRDGRPGDVAVLARVAAALLGLRVALADDGIPHAPIEGARIGMLERPGVQRGLALLAALRTGGALPLPLGVDSEERLRELAAAGAASAVLLAAWRDAVGVPDDDLDTLVTLAPRAPDPRTFAGWLADRTRPDGPWSRGGREDTGVLLSTIHRVKGREWPHVIVVGLRDGLLPHRLATDAEEERRVLHVAMTRALATLTLVADRDRPSPFLPELLGTLAPSAGASGASDDDSAQAAARAEVRTLELLRTWRATIATQDRVPAFLVAHDRTLHDLARRRPRDLRALRACHGIGPRRLERFGGELLAIVAAGARDAGGRTGDGTMMSDIMTEDDVATEHGVAPLHHAGRTTPREAR
jgi:DNA helicase II / ATP-dependent DNA helicase PcrA